MGRWGVFTLINAKTLVRIIVYVPKEIKTKSSLNSPRFSGPAAFRNTNAIICHPFSQRLMCKHLGGWHKLSVSICPLQRTCTKKAWNAAHLLAFSRLQVLSDSRKPGLLWIMWCKATPAAPTHILYKWEAVALTKSILRACSHDIF